MLLRGEVKLEVPVYTVWGACEDVRVLEKFRSGEYKVPNLHIIDEARSMLLEIGGVKLRLLGLGGAVVMHKLFDNGEGRTTIAGGQGTMWTTLLQMGELVDTANRVYDPTETRVFLTHASPAREGILNQLSVTLKADFSISAGLHFRYGSSYNEFSVNPTLDHYRGKLAASKASFNDVWETVKAEVEPAIQQNEAQQNLLRNALGIVDKMPSTAAGGNPFGGQPGGPAALGQVDESAFKNMWNFNLADAAFGWLVLEIQDGRIGTEMRAQGFNFSHRGAKQQGSAPQGVQAPTTTSASSLPPPAAPNAQSAPVNAPLAQRQGQSPQVQPPRQPSGQPYPGQPAKAGTPQPRGPDTSSPAPKDGERSVANGSAGRPDPVQSPAPKTQADSIIGLFVMNATSDDQVRELFADEDKPRISRLERWGAAQANNRVVHFKTAEDRDGALSRVADEFTKNRSQEDRSKPLVQVFQSRGGSKPSYGRGGGAGSWGASNRGGPAGASNSQSGYRSGGGTASDSEGGARGGRGGRGGAPGGRGRGDGPAPRGGRGGRGRGAPGKGDNASSPAPAPAAPAES
jgi:hypothetical protein